VPSRPATALALEREEALDVAIGGRADRDAVQHRERRANDAFPLRGMVPGQDDRIRLARGEIGEIFGVRGGERGGLVGCLVCVRHFVIVLRLRSVVNSMQRFSIAKGISSSMRDNECRSIPGISGF
jgi:hypothetical protein